MRHCLRVFCRLYLGYPTESTKAVNSSHGGYCLARPKLRTAWEELRPKEHTYNGERGGSVVECRTPEREVRGSRPTSAVLCPWARHFTPRKYWLITQEAMAPSRHDWKIVDWDVKPQHNQPTILTIMHYTEYNVNMQKHFLNNHTPLSQMQLESTKKRWHYLNSKACIYHKTSGINPENKC